ncbi:thiazole synthase [Clostridium ihumii]|uniref:thiazole synthase n=1 Tax=Clostridium ihumii TaxID=1470356 RepID=UPI0005559D4A|nr:thiazole synthase [Clostridium ihumii]
MEIFLLGDMEFNSRLIIGTGKYSSNKIMPDIIKAAEPAMVTLALRRVDLDNKEENVLEYIDKSITLLPNTSGARNAEEAVRIARISRAMGCGDFIKLEIIPDTKYLMPDNFENIKATEILAKEGFKVMPYMSPDLIAAKRMAEAGAVAIMPLGAPIGSNRGIKTKELIRIMIEELNVPVIVDAGIGRPSEAAEAMEMGAAAVMLNTAIASSKNPIEMARAFKLAVEAGRIAYEAKLGTVDVKANASSPLTGFLGEC